jgi:hypothetical protein
MGILWLGFRGKISRVWQFDVQWFECICWGVQEWENGWDGQTPL